MKLAVISSGSIYQQQGLFNAVLNRVKHLQRISEADIDVFLISTYEPFLVRKLRHTPKQSCPKTVVVDGVTFNITWNRFFLLDYIWTTKLHQKSFRGKGRKYDFQSLLSQYDFVIAHSLQAGLCAMKAKQKQGVPYSVTWHGSDIHTFPLNNETTMQKTKAVIEAADINFFVSEDLMHKSEVITTQGNKAVLYNGADERFVKFDEVRRAALRRQYGVTEKKVVTFVGNFYEVKNVLKIPQIFRYVSAQCSDTVFWMIGDGKLLSEVKKRSHDLPITFWGNQPPEKIPEFLNCTEVQILPSLNEGLPLTMVEALRCGCHAVGSLVGGIPEVIGQDNCVPLDCPTFEQNVADLILSFLNKDSACTQILDQKFDWRVTAQTELSWISRLV